MSTLALHREVRPPDPAAHRLAVPVGTVDLGTGEIRAARPERLTDLERRLLLFLAARPGEAVDRDTLHREVFGYGDAVVTRAVDTAIARLRRKLGSACLATAYGRGYRFVPAVPVASAPTPAPLPARRLVLGATVVELDRRLVVRDGSARPLTEQNAALFELLWAATPRFVDHRTLSRALSLRGVAIRHAVRRLRHKLEPDPSNPRILVAVPGGYRLELVLAG